MSHSVIRFTPEERQKIIDRAIDKPGPIKGTRAGIFGAEPCQVCGELDTFRGWVSAMSSHWGGAFTCGRCRRELVKPLRPSDPNELTVLGKQVQAFLKATPYRYGVYCLNRTPLDKCVQLHRSWACRACHDNPSRDGLLSRRRYVEMTRGGDEELAAFDLSLEADALDMEDTIHPDRAPFRHSRATQRLREPGEAHGRDYSR